MSSNSGRADECRQQLLEGITTLPLLGTPGRVVVYGDDAIPVICGNNEGDVLVACAEYGKGRVIVLSQGDYLADIVGSPQDGPVARFQANMKQWVSRQQLTSDTGGIKLLTDSRSVENLDECKIVIWSGGELLSDVRHTVVNFMLGGGGLIYGVAPWQWLEQNKGKHITDMPLYNILQHAGIYFTREQMGKNTSGFSVSEALQKRGGLHAQSIKDQVTLMRVLPESGLQLSKLEHKRYQAKKWRAEILHGISSLPRIGLPGKITVFGDHAQPILSGDHPGDVLLAGAMLGKGRIAIISHDKYMKYIKSNDGDPGLTKLFLRIKEWVTNYTYEDDSNMSIWNQKGKLKLKHKTKTVVWKGGVKRNEDTERKVMEFVQSGGGLICGICPWGWLGLRKIRKEKPIHHMPIYHIAKMAGMSFARQAMEGNKEGFDVARSRQETNGGLHLGHALDRALVREFLEENGKGMASLLKSMPRDIIQLLNDKLYKVSRVHADVFQQCGPSPSSPVITLPQRSLIAMCETLLHHKIGMRKAPGINAFPGDFDVLPPLQSAELSFESRRPDFHPTGFYLPAGVDLTVEVKAMTGLSNWKVKVGAHKDTLYDKNRIKRWPNIVHTEHLPTDGTLTLSSPYGGLVYLVSPAEGDSTIDVKLDGVVESPLFDLRNSGSIPDWERRRQSPGLWADISGKFITITVPAESVRALDAPWEVMETWDRVVMAHNELRGTHPTDRRREFVVCDLQPGAGSMHSGHPIVTRLSIGIPKEHDGKKFMLDNEDILKTGSWGLFHELGHNMQRKWWTFEGTREVTCNIFTLHAMDVICGINPWDNPVFARTASAVRDYLNVSVNVSEWKYTPGVKLPIYAQLAHHFGWGAYKLVFRKYEEMDLTEKRVGDQEEVDMWITVFSQTVQQNLCPLFEFWGLRFSDTVRQALNSLPSFLPSDKMTTLAPERLASIRGKYPPVTRHSASASSAINQEHERRAHPKAVAVCDEHWLEYEGAEGSEGSEEEGEEGNKAFKCGR